MFFSRVCMPDMNYGSLMIQKLWRRLNFVVKIFSFRTKVLAKVTGSLALVSIERVSLVKCAYQIHVWNLSYLLCRDHFWAAELRNSLILFERNIIKFYTLQEYFQWNFSSCWPDMRDSLIAKVSQNNPCLWLKSYGQCIFATDNHRVRQAKI